MADISWHGRSRCLFWYSPCLQSRRCLRLFVLSFESPALLEPAGFIVPKLNIAAMLARCISAWPNVKVTGTLR